MIKENIKNLTLGDTKLVALTKDVSADEIREAMDAGIEIIGERYLNEASEKFKRLGKRVKWHFVGHIKLKEAKELVNIFDVIQTVDSLKAAKAINTAANRQEKIQKIMLRVNVAGDQYGVEPEDMVKFYNRLTGMMHLEVIGLMADADDNPMVCFRKMKNLNSKLKLKFLSMGTSKDYELAIKEGSNMVRLGDVIFGKGSESPVTELMNYFLGLFRRMFKVA
ncbi:MAG: YggS family pyridoxal phosphate-dependent enzyme [Candidatus Woesearchaeota archaeon]